MACARRNNSVLAVAPALPSGDPEQCMKGTETRLRPDKLVPRLLYDYNGEVAEFLAMTIFMMIGLSINATVVFRAATQPDAHDLTIAVGWGCALIGGIVMSMGVSGAHLNPALTFSLAVFGHFPWRRVPGMALAQVLGGFLAAFFTWLLYYPIWDTFSRLTVGERATAGIFIIQPTKPGVYGNGNLVFNEIVYSFSLLYFVFFIADKRMTLSASTGAILAGLFFAATILSGTQYVAVVAMNPARDLGPRLFIWAAGWKDVFTAHNYYFYVPLVGPFIGGVAARGIYDYVVVAEEVKPERIRRRYWNK